MEIKVDRLPDGFPIIIRKPPMFTTHPTLLDIYLSDSFSGGWVQNKESVK